jgi:hypothetical protein
MFHFIPISTIKHHHYPSLSINHHYPSLTCSITKPKFTRHGTILISRTNHIDAILHPGATGGPRRRREPLEMIFDEFIAGFLDLNASISIIFY